MSYSYDFRTAAAQVAADTTAAPKKPAIKPIAPRNEQDEVIKHLTSAHYIVKEWVIHSNPDSAMGHEYGATHETYQKVGKIRDELDELTEKIRRLHPSGV